MFYSYLLLVKISILLQLARFLLFNEFAGDEYLAWHGFRIIYLNKLVLKQKTKSLNYRIKLDRTHF